MTADRRDLLIPAIRSVRVADGCTHLDREEAWAVATALLPVIDRLCAEATAEALSNVAASLDNPEDATETALSGVAWPISVLTACASHMRDGFPGDRIHPTREDQQ